MNSHNQESLQPLQIKVCGMRSAPNMQEILALQPDWMGFIFYPKSARFVGEELDLNLMQKFPASTKKVGVFVNETLGNIQHAVQKYNLNAVQLHGEESPELCNHLKASGLLVFKAFSVDDTFDFEKLKAFEGTCDYYLFDTKGQQYGGNGTTFNWDILKKYTYDTPYFLSGGIDLEHVDQIKELSLPGLKGLDINSRFEISPALKDNSKVEAFFKGIRGFKYKKKR
ncbi:phosphoribosylanthranilate isomerase [Adhaeribacter aquaticus]|uniref:phosphoribosylanthranilate isomerase n=1 Tax=Adhaeribacter aquaticus TaxID=299567 RepID=UPI00047E0518|nr:phosphoribosylanthranilate isomerase [Adhaeribacter aquaticus]